MADISYDMEPNYLRVHEVNYELRIRGVSTSTADIPQKRKFLRRELKKDMARPNVEHELLNFNFEIERTEVLDSIQSITELVDNFDGTNTEVYKRICSRLAHVEGRLKRIPDNIGEEVSGFRGDNLIIVASLEDDVQDVVQKHEQANQGPHLQPTASTSVNNSYSVHKWSLKFDGTTSKCSVNAFLEQVEELSFARNISKEELFRASVELFTGQALIWYRHARDKVDSWDGLVSLLRKDFLSPRYDKELKEQISARRQGDDEPVILYIAAMENLYSRLVKKVSPEEKLETIRENLLPDYHMHLAMQNITSLDQLGDICRNLEEANILMKKRNIPYKQNVAAIEPDLECASKSSTSRQPLERQGGDTSGRNKVNTVNELRCFSCKKLGHAKRDCPRMKKIPKCYGCGKEGVIRPNCPRCSKNVKPRGTQ